MKYLIGLVLLIINIFLGYLLYANIQEPIAFQKEKKIRKEAVSSKLVDIRNCQEIYRAITDKFAPTFDTLKMVLRNDSIPFIKELGDADANEEVTIIKTFTLAMDSINALGIDLDDLEMVPFSDNKKFSIDADTMTYQQTLVNVVQVGTRYKEFMGKYGIPKYAKYDNSYDPNKMIKFGDMNKPNISGNWD